MFSMLKTVGQTEKLLCRQKNAARQTGTENCCSNDDKTWKYILALLKLFKELFFLHMVGNNNYPFSIIKIYFSIFSVPGTITSPYRNINYLQYIWKWFVQMTQIWWDEQELLLPSLLNWKQQSIICLSYVWIYFCPSVYHGTYHPKNQSLSSKKLGDECCWILFL